MVGRRGVQVAGLQAAPQKFLIAFGAKWRAHHVSGSGCKVGVAVDAVVQHQVPGQHFAVNALAAGAGACNRLGRFGIFRV